MSGTQERLTVKELYFHDPEAVQQLQQLLNAAHLAHVDGKPGMILAQLQRSRTGEGLMVDAYFLPHNQAQQLIDFIQTL